MLLLTAENLTKSYIERKLLDDTGLAVSTGDKLGIVGLNGTGKTTLLRILVGHEEADAGTVQRIGKVRIGYLAQNAALDPKNTVLQQVLQDAGGTVKEYECKTILSKLGLQDETVLVGTLSGGQQKRVALAAALVRPVDLLVLDEPTNHIDSDMVAWLEGYLAAYKGALLMVTHDRYFLDRVTNGILELDGGKIYRYKGNYESYLQLKAERQEMQAASQRKLQSLIRREVQWILQGPCARGTKSQYRIDRLAELKKKREAANEEQLELSSVASRLGRKVIELEDISKSYDGRQLFAPFSYKLLRNDRVGIIGANGAGKSTFIKILMGQLTPDTGHVIMGETVKIGYFSQQCEDMPLQKRPIDYIKDECDNIETTDGVLTASQMLEKFLFTSEQQYTTIARLSGGERRRLYLCKILMQAPNVLVLDEPTNDLDIETLTVLEDYLAGFPGAVLMVSHDRYFLDKIATQIFCFADGVITRTVGGYTDWQIQTEAEAGSASMTASTTAPAQKADAAESTKPQRTRTRELKFSFKEEREYASIDADIAALEAQLAAKAAETEREASNFQRLQELAAESEMLENQLSEKMERWAYLNDLAERIAQQNANR